MNDISYITIWWLILFVIGVINLPLSSVILKRFSDNGYGFSKTIGILITSFVVFLLSIIKSIPFSQITIVSTLLLLLIVNIYLIYKTPKILSKVRGNLRIIIAQEFLFIFGLAFWSWVRGHNPDINGLEKFMDYGFITSTLRGEYLPPSDMWFAGETINYYWFGHFVTALLTKLSAIPSAITYNLMIATIAGMTLTSAFSIVSTLVKNLKLKVGKTLLLAEEFFAYGRASVTGFASGGFGGNRAIFAVVVIFAILISYMGIKIVRSMHKAKRLRRSVKVRHGSTVRVH